MFLLKNNLTLRRTDNKKSIKKTPIFENLSQARSENRPYLQVIPIFF